MKAKYYPFVLAPLLLAAGNAQAFPVQQDLDMAADSYIWERPADQNTNFGTLTQIDLKNTTSRTVRKKGYLQVDLNGLDNLAEPLLAATLVLEFIDNGTILNPATPYNFEVYGLADVDDGWGETTVTWNNAPQNNTGGAGFLGGASLLGNFSVIGKGVGTVNFSSAALLAYLVSNVSSNQTASLLIHRTTDDSGNTDKYTHAFASRENTTVANRPILEITVDRTPPVPAPGVLALFLSGLIGLGWKYRKASGSSSASKLRC